MCWLYFGVMCLGMIFLGIDGLMKDFMVYDNVVVIIDNGGVY